MSKTVALLLVISLLTASCIIAFLPVKAELNVIVVPDKYPTIETAIENAAEGSTIFVKKGIYESSKDQTLVIRKALSLLGEDSNYTKIVLHPEWVTTVIFPDTRLSDYANPMIVEANDVRISGFTITSDGGEISVLGNRTEIVGNILNTSLRLRGSQQTLARNIITATINCDGTYGSICANIVLNATIGIGGSYNSIFANNLAGLPEYNIYGIGLGGVGDHNLIYDNIVSDGGGIGVNSIGNIVAKNTVTNGVIGISVDWGFDNVIFGNTITNNRGPGIKKEEGLNNMFYANDVAYNSIGVLLGTKGVSHSGKNTLHHNNFINNVQQTEIVNLDHSDYWDNGQEGNYWSDYRGSDANLNGIGDSPYVMFGDSYRENYPYIIYDDNYTDRYPLMAPFDISDVRIDLPDWATAALKDEFLSIDIDSPTVVILSPEKGAILDGNCSLTFMVNELCSWMGYSLDDNQTVTIAGNLTLIGLSSGLHNVTVYAKDSFGNMGASETVYFIVEVPEPFPTTLVAFSIVSVAVVTVGLLVYFKKRKH